MSKGRPVLGSVLIAVGFVLTAGVAGSFAWSQYQAQSLRSRLQQANTPIVQAAASSPAPSDAPAPAVAPATVTVVAPATTAPAPTPSPAPTVTAAPPRPAGPPVRIVIADLGIDAPVTEMAWRVSDGPGGPQSEWAIPENSAGHHVNSAPLGVPGNVVISGHNNIYGKVFQAISMAWDEEHKQQIDASTYRSAILDGRQIDLFSADGRKFTYRVTAFYRLHDAGASAQQRVENGRYMEPTADAQLTLITCWPPWSNTYRLVVRAALVP